MVLTTPEGFVRAVLPASDRIDLGKLREILGAEDVELATEAILVGAYPEFELGAVPPLTGGDGDRVLMDRRLCENEWVVVEAGTHEQSLRLRMSDLVGSPTRGSSIYLRTERRACRACLALDYLVGRYADRRRESPS